MGCPREMLTQAMDLDTTGTATSLEAALLETDEIKRWKPPYNIALSVRNRELCFVSRDFSVSAPSRDNICRLGPVPSGSCFDAVHRIGRGLRNTTEAEAWDIPMTLDMPAGYCPDTECFQSGISLFKEKYRRLLCDVSCELALRRIGRASWLHKIMEKAALQNHEPDESSDPAPPSDFEWTPEAVLKSLESVCRRCGFLLRRASWLALLSESTISWKISQQGSRRLNMIQLSEGQVLDRGQIHCTGSMPVPPNHQTPLSRRQTNIDLGTYDRLRVLTTEMRRLVADNRMGGIRLGTQRFLYPAQLNRLFAWV